MSPPKPPTGQLDVDESVPPSAEVEHRALGREQILTADDATYDWVKVPEWGGEVRIRTLTGNERGLFDASVTGRDDRVDVKTVRVRLVAMCIVDDAGKRIFSDLDVAKLGEKSSAAIVRVFEGCRKLNKMGDEFIEELQGNSDSGPSANGSSA